MNSSLENLKRRYEYIIKLPERELFIGIAEYVEYLDNNPEFKSTIFSIKNEKIILQEKFDQLWVEVNKDIIVVFNKLSLDIKSSRVKLDGLEELINEYELSHSYADLQDVVGLIYNSNHKALVVDLIKNTKEGLDYVISDSYLPAMEIYGKLINGERNGLFGALNELYYVYSIIKVHHKPIDYLTTKRLLKKDYYLNHLFRINQHIIETIETKESLPTNTVKTTTPSQWQGNFRWEGSTYIFGEYGKISFKKGFSKDVFSKLTDAYEKWVKTETLNDNDNKNAGIIVGQIRKRLLSKTNNHINIQSTQDVPVENRPSSSAYRIVFTPKL